MQLQTSSEEIILGVNIDICFLFLTHVWWNHPLLHVQILKIPELQIRRSNKDNSEIIFLISQ